MDVEASFAWTFATWVLPVVFAIVLHEIAHGWVASAFGDQTARDLGRLSPNPVRHVDPVGTVILPMLLVVTGAPVFGWAKPVPVVAAKLRRPRLHMMLVGLAGPGTNLALAFIAAFGMAFVAATADQPPGLATEFLFANLQNFMLINIFLAVFNMLPVPPFDGGHLVEGLLPRRLVPKWQAAGKYAMLVVLLLLVVLPMISPSLSVIRWIVVPPVDWLFGFIAGLAGFAVAG